MSEKGGLLSKIFSKLNITKLYNKTPEQKYEIEENDNNNNEDENIPEEFKSGYYVEIISGLEKGKQFELNKKHIPLGKLTSEKRIDWILIDTSTISADQATLKWDEAHLRFSIVHSTGAIAPTYVNGIEVSDEKPTFLRERDIIRLGNVELMFKRIREQREPERRKTDRQEGRDYSPSREMKPIRSYQQKTYNEPKHQRSYTTRSYDEDDEITTQKKKEPQRDKYHEKHEEIKDKTMDSSDENNHMFQIVGGPDKEKVITISNDIIEDRLIIGRKSNMRKDIELSDFSLSDCYASLSIIDNWLCINLEDENGNLFVNGISVKMKGLENGDIIKIGNTTIEHYITGPQSKLTMSSLEMLDGFYRGKSYPLKRNVIYIGRRGEDGRKDVELPDDDKSVSRQHAVIEKKNNKYYLINLKQKNLTFLNGIQVSEPRPLVNGDKIRIGNSTVFIFNHRDAPLERREPGEEYSYPQKEVKIIGQRKNVIRTRQDVVIGGSKDRDEDDDPTQTLMEKEEIPLPARKEETPAVSTREAIKDMIFIPGGSFWLGNDNPDSDATPCHRISVESFYIDRYAVTNLQYEEFIETAKYKSEGLWEDFFTEGKENYPVVGVTYNDAKAYAAWKGKRLPTEAEWEKAARGEEGFLYPWGDKWDPSKLCSQDGGELGPVDSYSEGVSPYGVFNMLGSVWEWTGDHYGNYPYKPSPVTSSDKEVVIRGGEWMTELKDFGVTIRAGIYMDESVESVGFRCAKSSK